MFSLSPNSFFPFPSLLRGSFKLNRTSDSSDVCSPFPPACSTDDSELGNELGSELGGGGGARPFGRAPADERTAGGGGITGGGGIFLELRMPSGDPGRPERRITCTFPSPGLGGTVSGGGGMDAGGSGMDDLVGNEDEMDVDDGTEEEGMVGNEAEIAVGGGTETGGGGAVRREAIGGGGTAMEGGRARPSEE